MVCKNLLRSLEVPFIQYFLKEKLLTHPEPESLLSISDILTKYKVESLELQIGEDKLDHLPLLLVIPLMKTLHKQLKAVELIEINQLRKFSSNLSF